MEETETDLQAAANYFALGQIEDSRGTQFGIGNENYHVRTDKGNFVVRRLWEQTVEGLKNEMAIQSQLREAGIRTSQLLESPEGSYVYLFKDQIVTVSKKIEGVHPERVDNTLAQKMGELLATFHQSVTKLPVSSKQWLNKDYAKAKLAELQEGELKTLIGQRITDNSDIFDLDLPKGVIHGDLYVGNLLITPEGELVVFDFETSEKNILLIDIARSILDMDSEEAFLKGYQQIRSLTVEELQNLKKAKLYVSGAMAAWLVDRGQEEGARKVLDAA